MTVSVDEHTHALDQLTVVEMKMNIAEKFKIMSKCTSRLMSSIMTAGKIFLTNTLGIEKFSNY